MSLSQIQQEFSKKLNHRSISKMIVVGEVEDRKDAHKNMFWVLEAGSEGVKIKTCGRRRRQEIVGAKRQLGKLKLPNAKHSVKAVTLSQLHAD